MKLSEISFKIDQLRLKSDKGRAYMKLNYTLLDKLH